MLSSSSSVGNIEERLKLMQISDFLVYQFWLDRPRSMPDSREHLRFWEEVFVAATQVLKEKL
jgi:hypothetical protein